MIGSDGLVYDNACYANAAGVTVVRSALQGLGQTSSTMTTVWKVLAAASMAASAYHGYKRNHGSVGWAIGWGFLGGLFPVITPAIAVAEGFGKPKRR